MNHEWGTDGCHSNEYCKKCFVDRKGNEETICSQLYEHTKSGKLMMGVPPSMLERAPKGLPWKKAPLPAPTSREIVAIPNDWRSGKPGRVCICQWHEEFQKWTHDDGWIMYDDCVFAWAWSDEVMMNAVQVLGGEGGEAP